MAIDKNKTSIAKNKTSTTKSKLEADLLAYLIDQGIAPDTTNMPIAQDREWTCDMVWLSHKIALEVEGGAFSGGRHTRGKGYTEDCEKYNAMSLNGWIVLRYTTTHLRPKNRHKIVEDLRLAFQQRARGLKQGQTPCSNPQAAPDANGKAGDVL